MTNQILSKEDITEMLTSDKSFQKILNSFKYPDTTGFKVVTKYHSSYNNGLGSHFYVITTNNEVSKIIVPLFSSSRTITWTSEYFDWIKESMNELDVEYIDEEVGSKVILVLNYFDQESQQSIFMQACNMRTFMKTAYSGQYSSDTKTNKYKWIDSLPDKTALTLDNIKDQFFVDQLPNMSYEQLYDYSLDYAENHYENFYNPNNRDKETLIQNIAQGMAIELNHGADLISQYGMDHVYMNMKNTDDKGIDIIFKNGKNTVNIDVKSTKSDNLSISIERDETDYYAIYNANSKYKYPKFLGYVHKKDFWTDEVKEYRGRYLRTIDSLKPHIIEDATYLFARKSQERLNRFKMAAL